MKKKPLIPALLGLLVLSTGVAAAAPADGAQNVERVFSDEVTISDAMITISDTELNGPGLPDVHIDDRTYTLDTTIDVDGLDVTFDGKTYVFCDVTIHVQDVGLHIENVTLSNGS